MADNHSSTNLNEQFMDLNISNTTCSSEAISPQATINDNSNNDDIKNSRGSQSMPVKTLIICSDNQKSECEIISSKNKNFRCNEESLVHNDTIVISDDNDSDWEDIDDNDGDSNDTVLLSDDSDGEDIDDNDDTALLSDDNGVENIDDNDDTALLTDDKGVENIDDNDDTALLSDDNGVENIDDHNDTVVIGDDNDGDSDDYGDAFASNLLDYKLLTDPILLTLNIEQAKIYFFMNSEPVIRRFIHEPSKLDYNVVMYDKNEIVEILDVRFFKDNLSFYLVKWKNWSRGFNTWERMGALYKSQEHIIEFNKNKKCCNKPINIMHPMINRQIITELFNQFKTSTGLSMPINTLKDISCFFNDLKQGSENLDKEVKMCLKSHLATLSLDFFRQQQEHKLKHWEIEINLLSKNYNVKVENNIDLEDPPISFEYITSYYIPEGKIIIPDNRPPNCLCKTICSSEIGCCKILRGRVPFIGMPASEFECNKRCKCLSSCGNRIVQYGSKVKVCIYKSTFPGWALKTHQNIDKGQFVGVYIGEIITVQEYNQRLQNSSSSIDYTLKLNFYDRNDFKCIVDSTHYGNFTRFINHSCEANLSIRPVWIDCLDRYLPQLALFADRDILAGEQLTTDYFISRGKDSLKKSGIKCHCQMKKCKGYYF